jgi:hypothetical protein
MRIGAGLALALVALWPVTAQAKGQGACAVRGAWNFPRKANLPAGAAAALGFAMAERGAPWNVSDDVGPGPMLPFARFISARQVNCTLEIRYEHGGIAHTYETALLQYQGRRWVLVRSR